MPPKARPPAADAEKLVEPDDTAPEAGPSGPPVDEKPSADAAEAAVEPTPQDGDGEPQADAPRPGVYRFTWPYSCVYNLPGQASKAVEPGEEVFWPAGPPDRLWEFVSDQPAPAPSDNT